MNKEYPEGQSAAQPEGAYLKEMFQLKTEPKSAIFNFYFHTNYGYLLLKMSFQ